MGLDLAGKIVRKGGDCKGGLGGGMGYQLSNFLGNQSLFIHVFI